MSLPTLPTEVKAHIIRFCDPSTLAQTSKASLAMLELSTPCLYRDVVLHGLPALESFFCSRDEQARELHPSTFALTHTRSLTFHTNGTIDRAVTLSRDRLPSGTAAVLLDLLVLRPWASVEPSSEDPELEWEVWATLLPLFDPVSVHVIGERDLSLSYAQLPSVALHDENLVWPRLGDLRFTNASASSFLGYSFFLIHDMAKPLQVTYHLDRQWDDLPTMCQGPSHLILFDLSWLEDAGPSTAEESAPIFEFAGVSVVVKVASEEDTDDLLNDIYDGWSCLDIEDYKAEDWESRLAIEVVDQGSDEDDSSEGEDYGFGDEAESEQDGEGADEDDEEEEEEIVESEDLDSLVEEALGSGER